MKVSRAVLVLAAILFICNIWGYDLWAPDEPFFGEGAREMVVDGHWLVTHINGKVNTHKPPFFFWLIALLSLPLGRITSLTARLPSALAALARSDRSNFALVLSGMDPDPVWWVRAALATALALADVLVELNQEEISYQGHRARRIVFCEGNGVSENPYFNSLPLEGTKGELITIHAPDLKLNEVIKSAVFVMPLGDDLYKIGATFNWSDKTNRPTDQGREELLKKLKTVISCDFEIRDHEAGVRPTTPDRRPLLGKHPDHPQLAVFNGLGTRGVMSSPLLAIQLVEHLENEADLVEEVDIYRFRHLLRA